MAAYCLSWDFNGSRIAIDSELPIDATSDRIQALLKALRSAHDVHDIAQVSFAKQDGECLAFDLGVTRNDGRAVTECLTFAVWGDADPMVTTSTSEAWSLSQQAFYPSLRSTLIDASAHCHLLSVAMGPKPV